MHRIPQSCLDVTGWLRFQVRMPPNCCQSFRHTMCRSAILFARDLACVFARLCLSIPWCCLDDCLCNCVPWCVVWSWISGRGVRRCGAQWDDNWKLERKMWHILMWPNLPEIPLEDHCSICNTHTHPSKHDTQTLSVQNIHGLEE